MPIVQNQNWEVGELVSNEKDFAKLKTQLTSGIITSVLHSSETVTENFTDMFTVPFT